MLEPLWGEKLIFPKPGFMRSAPRKGLGGNCNTGSSAGVPHLRALPTWIPLAPTRNAVGPRSHQGCWKVGWPHCLGRSRVLGQSFLCFYQAFQQKPGAVKPGSQGNRGPGQLLGWGTAPC